MRRPTVEAWIIDQLANDGLLYVAGCGRPLGILEECSRMSDDWKRETTADGRKGVQMAVPSRKGVQRAVEPAPAGRADPKPAERKG